MCTSLDNALAAASLLLLLSCLSFHSFLTILLDCVLRTQFLLSRQFSYKFHDFFNTVIMNWGVLGTVDHYYWKEFQIRGAPHYHIVLWTRDSPVLGRDSPEKVLPFIQERITCHIPDNKTSPDACFGHEIPNAQVQCILQEKF